MKKKNITLINILGAVGCLLWVSAIFLRGTDITQNETVSFFFGIAPNFGVGMLIPMLAVTYYPVIFQKEITFKKFIFILMGSYALLFVSEVIHDKLLDSRFDFYDMIASLVAFGIMALSYKCKRVIFVNEEKDLR